MKLDQFRDKMFEYALGSGCGAAEVYFTEGEQFEVTVLSGEVDKYSVSRTFGLNLRVQVNGRNGYAYTEILEEPEALVERAMDNAKTIENDDEQPMQGKSEYVSVQNPDVPLMRFDEREKIQLALQMEKAALEQDKRVLRVPQCTLISAKGRVNLYNTLGLCAEEESEIAVTYLCPVISNDGEIKDGFAFRIGSAAHDVEAAAKEAVLEAVIKLGASSVPAGSYRVLLRNTAAADILDAFSPMFSADNAQKGLSLLADTQGQSIAADIISIVDDPFYKDFPRAFDGEGVPSVLTDVVENGVQKSLLHNLKTAKKAAVASTSNGGRNGAAAPVGVTPSNFYIKPGQSSYDSLVAKLDNGLIITDIAGTHAGVDAVSGEFSLLAKGQLVKDGKTVRAVEQITVGGSFIELMKRVSAVGDDLKFGMPSSGCFGSPSLLISELVVAGE
ncbi:MAG: TldD/PmbA family protein [Clostridia bacterium]